MNLPNLKAKIVPDSKAIRYIVIVALTPLIGVILAALLLSLFEERLPAPHISNSIAFNEKARWLKNHLSGNCDVLILGSSMALNNIDTNELRTLYPNTTIINTSSWGMSIEESYEMLEKILSFCTPKSIILVTNYPDFFSASEKEIDWDRFERYLRKESVGPIYMENFNLTSFFADYRLLEEMGDKGRSFYGSLAFDGTGTVNLECQKFEIDTRRWDGYKFDSFHPSKIRASAVQAISLISEGAQKIGSQFIVLTTPMRQVAEMKVFPEFRAGFWEDVKARTEQNGGLYIRSKNTSEFGDTLFADFVHLNECGSTKITRIMVEAVKHAQYRSVQH